MGTLGTDPGRPRPALPGAGGEPFTLSAPVREGRSVRVAFGPGSLDRVSPEALQLGGRVFLIAGRHAADAARAVAADLGEALVGRVDEVVEHVPVGVADAALSAAAEGRAEVLVSIGGGSATGLAKAVALQTGLPILAVPTTYAGSEMTSVWGRSERGRKATGRDLRVLPRTVVYDPTLTVSMPPHLTAASGMNALAHAVESLYAPDATEETAEVAEEAIRALAHGLPRAVHAPGDLAARSGALRGAWLAGWSLGSTTMGLHHRLAHVLGGRYRLPHAGVHSALLPQVAAFTARGAPDAFRRAARALGVGGPDDVAPALFELAEELGAPTSLRELGLRADALPAVVEATAGADLAHPGIVRRDDLDQVLRRAHDGLKPGSASARGA